MIEQDKIDKLQKTSKEFGKFGCAFSLSSGIIIIVILMIASLFGC